MSAQLGSVLRGTSALSNQRGFFPQHENPWKSAVIIHFWIHRVILLNKQVRPSAAFVQP